MIIETHTIEIESRGICDIHDVTPLVHEFLEASGCVEGLATVSVPGSTAGITTIEFESGVVEDLKAAIERLAPQEMPYGHDARWGDGNGFSHVRAAMMGPSLSTPIVNGHLQLGTWQQIVLCDFDNRPRQRKVTIQILGK